MFGDLRIDHVDLGFGLDVNDWSTPLLAGIIGSVSIDGLLEAKTLDVTAAVQVDMAAARTTSDYRLFFIGPPDGGFDDDFLQCTNTGVPGTVGVEPTPTVTYALP